MLPCIPSLTSAALIKVCAGLHLTVSSSIVIFGIGIPPIWQGVIGILTSLEGVHGAQQGMPTRVFIFLLGLFINVILGVQLGLQALTEETYADCSSTIEGVAVRQEQNLTIFFDGIVMDCAVSFRVSFA
mmetsp:Transcript_16399/g.30023  ORF Transcript_16399/g.30023 Transcript_16399/m.30023 type:complete len:129 (-) Transcript_16399:2527-2913(-)